MLREQFKDSEDGVCPYCKSDNTYMTDEFERLNYSMYPVLAFTFNCKACNKKFRGLYLQEFSCNEVYEG